MMDATRRRLEALISDSGQFSAGAQHERERIRAIIKLRQQDLDVRSAEHRECVAILHAISQLRDSR